MPDIAHQTRRQRVGMLVGIGAASILLWQTQIGAMALYPLTILATWFHEMGHGLAAMLTGSSFERLVIYPNGSGVATSLRSVDAGRITGAIIAAAGPLGPAIAGALLLASSRTEKGAHVAIEVLGWALLISTAIWVRSLTGWLVLPAIGVAVLLLSRRAKPSAVRLTAQILGVQAGISAWRQFDYLFSAGGTIDGRLHRSDTGAIEDALLLPHWVWGAALSVGIVALLWWGMRRALR